MGVSHCEWLNAVMFHWQLSFKTRLRRLQSSTQQLYCMLSQCKTSCLTFWTSPPPPSPSPPPPHPCLHPNSPPNHFPLPTEAQSKPYYSDYSPTRLLIHKMCTSHYLDLFITIVIGLNVITMSMEHYQQPKVRCLGKQDPGLAQSFGGGKREKSFTNLFTCQSKKKSLSLNINMNRNENTLMLNIKNSFGCSFSMSGF